MSFMSIISAIVTFIRFIPELLKIWKEVSALLQDAADKSAAKEVAKEVADAIKVARETKDTSNLEDMFGPKSFNVTFKTVEQSAPVEKKSLDFGTPLLSVRIVEQKKLTDKLEEFLALDEPKNPLKEIEKLVKASESLEIIEVPEVIPEPEKPKPKISIFGFGSNANSQIIGASVISNVYMTGRGRMGSNFYAFLLICLLLAGCKQTQVKNQPTYKPKLYAGDSSVGGLVRKQSGEFIRATDPKMDNMVATTYATFACIHKTYIENCSAYKQKAVSCEGLDSEFYKDFINSTK